MQQNCGHCEKDLKYAEKLVFYRNKYFCCDACRDAYKTTPKPPRGNMSNKGSRTTPCGFGFGESTGRGCGD